MDRERDLQIFFVRLSPQTKVSIKVNEKIIEGFQANG